MSTVCFRTDFGTRLMVRLRLINAHGETATLLVPPASAREPVGCQDVGPFSAR
jgi:hypothetical protein